MIVAKRLPKRPPLLRREPLRSLSIRVRVDCLEPNRRIPNTTARHAGVRLGWRHLTVAAGISKPVTLDQQLMTDFFSTLLTLGIIEGRPGMGSCCNHAAEQRTPCGSTTVHDHRHQITNWVVIQRILDAHTDSSR
jgi:hypothetical protein